MSERYPPKDDSNINYPVLVLKQVENGYTIVMPNSDRLWVFSKADDMIHFILREMGVLIDGPSVNGGVVSPLPEPAHGMNGDEPVHGMDKPLGASGYER